MALSRGARIGLLTVAIIALVVAAFAVGPDLLDILFDYLETVDSSDPWTGVVLCALLWATVTPFVFGYGFVLLAIGFVYGWWGFFLAYLGSISGAIVVFALTRAVAKCTKVSFKDFAKLPILSSWQRYLLAGETAVEAKPYKLCTLFQLSFLPFGLLNSVFALTKVAYAPFVCACFVSRLKVINYIWLGATTRDLAEIWRSVRFDLQDVIILIVSSVFSLVSLAAITYWAKKALDRELDTAVDDGDVTSSWTSSSDSSSEDEEEEEGSRQGDGLPVPAPLQLHSAADAAQK